MKPTISPVGDRAISIDFGQVIDPTINRHIRQTIERIKELQLEGIIELSHNHLSEDEVISIHSGTDYLVYMLGFIPGFTYLGGMDPRIATPRLSSPRTLIPAGSVGIAGEQTGTYPSDSPGGWQIIGRTPVTMYDMSKAQAALLKAGDYVRYVPIDESEFHRIKALGTDYAPVIREVEVGDLRGVK